MKLRQSVISIFSSDGAGGFRATPEKNIIFYQPYHNFGLAYSFNFSKSYFAPVTDCQIIILNPDNSISEALAFDYNKPQTRPIIRIWAGYSDFRLRQNNEVQINFLKSTLDEVYSGFPVFYSDDRQVASGGAGRELSIDLTDIAILGAKRRVSTLFSAGKPVIDIVKDLINRLGVNADFSDLENNPVFRSISIGQSVYYNNRLILEDIIPDLERQYVFTHFTGNTGDLIFKVLDNQGSPAGAAFNEISSDNGLIGFANTVNWVDVEFKTLFGRPEVYYPGDRVSVKAPNLNPLKNTEGLILTAGYTWGDSDAEISYSMNTFGQPANPFPILRL